MKHFLSLFEFGEALKILLKIKTVLDKLSCFEAFHLNLFLVFVMIKKMIDAITHKAHKGMIKFFAAFEAKI